MADGNNQLLGDKDFLSAPSDEQIRYLSSVDQNFAKASKEDQMGYISHLRMLSGTGPAQEKAAFTNLPKATVPLPTGLRGAGTGSLIDPISGGVYNAEHPADVSPAGAASNYDQANLAYKARTGKDLPGYAAKKLGAGVGADISGGLGAAMSPQGLATQGALGLAFTNPYTGIPVGGAMALHGLYNMYKAAPGALAGRPEDVQSALLSGSEVAGGVAGGAASTLGGTPPEITGRRQLMRAIRPGGTGALQKVETMQAIDRAAPYLAAEERLNPVKAQQPPGSAFEGERLGAANLSQNARSAGKKLWENEIEPRAAVYDQAPIDHSQVASDVRGTQDPASFRDDQREGRINAIADFYDTPTTVGDALQKIRGINEDPAIKAYERADPIKQAEMVQGNPELEAKIRARDSLHDQVFNEAIASYGSQPEADYLKSAREDFGALKDVARWTGNAQVPTSQSGLVKALNTMHGVVSPMGAHAYTSSSALDTLFHLSDPDRLAAAASASFGRSALQPRVGPPIPTSPWTSPTPQYPSGAVGPFGGPVNPVGNPPPAGFGAQYNPFWDRVISSAAQPAWEPPPSSPEEITTPTLPSYSPGYRNLPSALQANLPASLRMLPPRKR